MGFARKNFFAYNRIFACAYNGEKRVFGAVAGWIWQKQLAGHCANHRTHCTKTRLKHRRRSLVDEKPRAARKNFKLRLFPKQKSRLLVFSTLNVQRFLQEKLRLFVWDFT